MSRTALRICPLCEATCGLSVTVEEDVADGRELLGQGRVTAARGDRDDVFSKGFICPKGAAFGQLDADPDRLTRPLVRRDGQLREAGWDEAFAAVQAGLRPVIEEHGANAVAVVLGNPNVHTVAGALYPPVLLSTLRTRNVFTASTVDQMPKHVSSGLLYGDPLAIPVPDLDRTDHLVVIGANPLDSNGSLCTAPDFPGRLKALRRRGGRLTVIDPRRTRTARIADRHLAIRPGTDALLLFAMVQVLFDEGLVDLGERAAHIEGVADVERLAAEFTPEAVAPACEVPADEIRTLAREAGGRGARGGIRPDRRQHRRVRHPHLLARRCGEHPHRQLRPAGRRDVPAVRDRRGAPAAEARPGIRARPLAQPRLRPPRGQVRASVRRAGRGDRHAGGGAGAPGGAGRPGPCGDRHRRQPGAVRPGR